MTAKKRSTKKRNSNKGRTKRTASKDAKTARGESTALDKPAPAALRYFFYIGLVVLIVLTLFVIPDMLDAKFLHYQSIYPQLSNVSVNNLTGFCNSYYSKNESSIGSAAGGLCSNYTSALANSSIALSLIFPFIVFAYLMLRGKGLRRIISELGLSKRKLTYRYVALGVLLFLLFFGLEFFMGAIEELTHVYISSNVTEYLSNLPLYFYVFVFLVAPIDEEILFRGFMVPRFGIVLSALVFGALHYISYFSYIELIAAFVFGLAAGYVFKKTNSLYPSIIGHMLFDFSTVFLLFFI
ncbi:MAG: CPBP family intramembrane glutamic endopeptidase [Candidatus Micrarchaeia archaeon]